MRNRLTLQSVYAKLAGGFFTTFMADSLSVPSPVALRSKDPALIHVPVVLQCLLNIPRVQERLAIYDPETPANDVDESTTLLLLF